MKTNIATLLVAGLISYTNAFPQIISTPIPMEAVALPQLNTTLPPIYMNLPIYNTTKPNNIQVYVGVCRPVAPVNVTGELYYKYGACMYGHHYGRKHPRQDPYVQGCGAQFACQKDGDPCVFREFFDAVIPSVCTGVPCTAILADRGLGKSSCAQGPLAGRPTYATKLPETTKPTKLPEPTKSTKL